MKRRAFLASAGLGAGGIALTTSSNAEEQLEYTSQDVEIESFDGTSIRATLFEPVEDGEYPVVLGTHGWGGDRSSSIGSNFAPRGYVVLSYDSRGYGESEGVVGLDGPKEINDVSALIDWLEKRDKVAVGENGPRVGMVGGSYAGGIQLNAAALDDRINAIVPRIAWNDLTYSLQPNGVVKTIWLTGLYVVGIGGARARVFEEGVSIDERADDLVTGLDLDLTQGFAEAVIKNDLGDDREAYLKNRSPDARIDEIDVPALFIQGWTDHLFVPNEAIWNFEKFRERDRDAKLVMFNGGHAQFPLDDDPDEEAEIRDRAKQAWLDAYLKQDQKALERVFHGHDVLVYEEQTERIRGADGIPPSGTKTVETDLNAGVSGGISSHTGESAIKNTVLPLSNSYVLSDTINSPAAKTFEFDAGELFGLTDGEKADVLTVPELDIVARTIGTDASLFIRLFHVTEDGEETHINNSVTPVKLDGDLVGTIEQTVELIAFQRYFSAGDKLRVVIDSTDIGFNSSRSSLGAIVDHETTLRIPGVTIIK